MAGAKSGVHVVQLKQIHVPPTLVRGGKFIKWDDVSAGIQYECHFVTNIFV